MIVVRLKVQCKAEKGRAGVGRIQGSDRPQPKRWMAWSTSISVGCAERGGVPGIVRLVSRRQSQEGVTYERGASTGWYTQGRFRTDV